jgi:hypothetical protein
MPGTDFSKYHTYKWVEIPRGIHPNQIIDQEIRQAVNNTLAGSLARALKISVRGGHIRSSWIFEF